MLNEQVIPIDFGQGVDTKTDPKLVVAGKMLRLENAVFTNPKRFAKRNGYTALTSTVENTGALVAPKMVHAYNDELIVADSGSLMTYSSSQPGWVRRGSYTSVEMTTNSIDQEHPVSGYTDVAILGNYALYAYTTPPQANVLYTQVHPKVYGVVVDLSTGATVCGPTLLATSLTYNVLQVKCVTLGSSALAVLYVSANESQINLRTVTFGGGGLVSFSSANGVSNNFILNVVGPTFDVVNTSTGAALFYPSFSTTARVSIDLLNTSGAVASSTFIVDANREFINNISIGTNNNIWIYWSENVAGVYRVVYAVYTSALVSVLTNTTLFIAAAGEVITSLISLNNSATQQTSYFRRTNVSQKASTYYITATSAGVVGTAAVFALGVTPASKPITVASESASYAVFINTGEGTSYATITGSTYFLVKIDPVISAGQIPVVVSRFASGVANNLAYTNQTNNIALLSTSKYIYSAAVETQEYNTDYFAAIATGGVNGEFSYIFDFAGPNSYRATNSSELAVLNGGLVQAYDGLLCTELGFHTAPEITVTSSGTAGSIAAGTYSYLAIFQWTDAQGNLHQSAPSNPKSITFAAGSKATDVVVTTAYLTQKVGVSIAIYRTNDSGTVYRLVTDPVFVIDGSPASNTYITFIDKLSDAQLAANPIAYTYPASPVLENNTPPPSMILTAHNNRLWMVDVEQPNTIWYSKSFSQLVGLSPSAFLTQQIDPKFGNIVALAEMDDKLLIFKETGIFYQSGDGANDAGTQSSLSFPQQIPSDVGCLWLKSVVQTPTGVMFQSPNGIYMIGRALQVAYIGLEVEGYNSQTVVSAVLVPGKSQIRFLVGSGKTLVYDYIFNQWSTFTNHTGTSSTSWANTYVYATTSGLIFQENSTSYLDNATSYQMLLQTSWLALASVNGFQRVKRLVMLGDYANGSSASHSLGIQIAYDFSTSFSTAVTYTFGSSSSSGVFQYRERLPQQKCDTLSLLITEGVDSVSGEYIDLTNISFEAGIKKGLNKLASGQSVG